MTSAPSCSKSFKYDHPEGFDPARGGYPWAADRQILAWVPANSSVLELGCATGYVGRYLSTQRGCRVTGIEADPAAADLARPYYERVICGNLEKDALWTEVSGEFDVILCMAVLEHLTDPVAALRQLSRRLRPGGSICLSLPNIAHWSIRRRLLRGRFDYSDYGILDRTHKRFFTYDTAQDLLRQAGLTLEKLSIDPDAGIPLFNGLLRRLPGGWAFLRWFYNRLPNLFAYQILMKARR